MTEPFVSLMRKYCIDYTNSHDLSVCDSIMEPGYTVHISGMALVRDESYKPAVETVFERFPNLGLVVHEFETNGDRLAMRFSEHAATPERGLACWAGIGLYDWNGTRLTRCRVEQDFWSQQRQLQTGDPDALEVPHVDPWTMTEAIPADPVAESIASEWLTVAQLGDAAGGRVDEGAPKNHVPIVAVQNVEVHDLFSAGRRVAFHASFHGEYAGGLEGFKPNGQPLSVAAAGLLTMGDETVVDAHVVTDRFGAWMQLASVPTT
jgi:predicted ester cyclase